MALADLNTRDHLRLAMAFNEARKRRGELPPLADLLPALADAANKDGDLVENLVSALGEPIRGGIDLVNSILTAAHGSSYKDELWDRIHRRSPPND